jgi:hypothetical protein
MCYCGIRLDLTASAESEETATCLNCGRKYQKKRLAVSELEEKKS